MQQLQQSWKICPGLKTTQAEGSFRWSLKFGKSTTTILLLLYHPVSINLRMCHSAVLLMLVLVKYVWWMRYLLFLHRNCIRAWPGIGHLYTVHDIIGSQNLLRSCMTWLGSGAASFVISWSPGSHLNSLNKTGEREESHQRRAVTGKWECISVLRKVAQMGVTVRCYDSWAKGNLNWI